MQQFAERREILAGRRQIAMLDRHVVVACRHCSIRPDAQVTVPSPCVVPTIAGALSPREFRRRIARHTEDVDRFRRHRPRAAPASPHPSCVPQPARRVELLLRRRRRLAIAEPEIEDLLAGSASRCRLARNPGGHHRLRAGPEAIDEAALGQQLQRAPKTGNDLEYFPHVVREIEAHQERSVSPLPSRFSTIE
jgi:hypothetical protein